MRQILHDDDGRPYGGPKGVCNAEQRDIAVCYTKVKTSSAMGLGDYGQWI